MLLPHQLISSFCTRFSHYHLLFGGLGIAKMSQARTICYVKHMYIGWNCLVWPLQQQTLWHSGRFSGTWCPLVSLGEGAPAQESGRASPGILPCHPRWEAMGLCGGVCNSRWCVPWCRNPSTSIPAQTVWDGGPALEALVAFEETNRDLWQLCFEPLKGNKRWLHYRST